MANALKKITTAAKAYRKKHPKTSWKSAVKKAGVMYRSGKLKAKAPAKKTVKRRVVKKKAAKKAVRRVVKKRATRKRVVKKSPGAVLFVEKGGTKRTKPKRVYRVVRTKKGTYSGTKRIAGADKGNMKTVLLFAALAVGGYFLLNQQNRNNMVYIPTGNINRDSRAQEIMNYVSLAGATATQIANLIRSLNTKSDNEIDSAYDEIQSGGNPLWLYA